MKWIDAALQRHRATRGKIFRVGIAMLIAVSAVSCRQPQKKQAIALPATVSLSRPVSLEPASGTIEIDETTGDATAPNPLSSTPRFVIRAHDALYPRTPGVRTVSAIMFERYRDNTNAIDPHWRLIFRDTHARTPLTPKVPFSLTTIVGGRELWTPWPKPGRGLTGYVFPPGRYRATLSFVVVGRGRASARLTFRVKAQAKTATR